MRAAEAHKPYRKKVIKILLTKNDKEELQRCFTRWKYGGLKRLPIMPYIVAKRFLKKVLCRRAYNEFVKKMTERNPKVLQAKGKDLIKTLKDIRDHRLKEFLIKLIRFIQRKYLGKIQPKINDKIKEYYLRKYFERWVQNTIEETKRKKEMLAQWLKNKFENDKINRDNRIKDLLNKFIKKKQITKKINVAYGFYKYIKNVKKLIQIENAKIIQDFCRKVLNEVIKNKLDKQQKLVDLMIKLHRKKFFKDLKELSKIVSPYIKNLYMKTTFRLERLRKVVKYNDRIKNLELLRKYWNIWKNNKGLLDDYSILLQKKVRQFLAKKKLRLYQRLNEILLKIITYNKDKKKQLLAYRLNQWRKKARQIECDENARIIQKFCRDKLKNYLKDKLAKYLEQLAKKWSRYLVNNAAKVDRLNKALKHKPFNEVIDALIRKILSDDLKQILLRLISQYDDKYKKLILKYYLEKWFKKANLLKNRENDAASRLQASFKGYIFRKYFGIDEKRTRMLLRIIEKLIMASNPINYLGSALARWRKITARIQCEENAKIIQAFCRKIHDKYLRDKINKNFENYKRLAEILNKLKISPKEFFDRLN